MSNPTHHSVCRSCRVHKRVRDYYAVHLRVHDEPQVVELCGDCVADPQAAWREDWRLVEAGPQRPPFRWFDDNE